MANRQSRNIAVMHLARSVVRENVTIPEFLDKLVRALDEEGSRLGGTPGARAEDVAALEQDARLLEKLVNTHRREFS